MNVTNIDHLTIPEACFWFQETIANENVSFFFLSLY